MAMTVESGSRPPGCDVLPGEGEKETKGYEGKPLNMDFCVIETLKII
jgi:hypothetical protein